MFLLQPALAQRGPGGVSTENAGQSSCRIWYDAASLINLADGDLLTAWSDISHSAINDIADVPVGQLAPYFSDDAANSINGYPVVTFDDGRFLQINSSTDLNLASVTHTKTVFLAFRTSTDVSTKQVLYEEGGCWRGFNVYIHDGLIYVGGYDLNNQGIANSGTGPQFGLGRDGDGTPQWGYSFVSNAIQANTTYVVTAQFSAPTPGVLSTDPLSDTFFIKGWLNGSPFSSGMDFNTGNLTNTNGGNTGVNGIGTLFIHPDPIGLGAINEDLVDKDGTFCNRSGQRPFRGRFAELAFYNDLLNTAQRTIVENYLGAKYFANFITNNKFVHKPTYGNEVIGIGQETNSPSQRHSVSRGRNPFTIQAASVASYYAAGQYFMVGRNRQPMAYTQQGVPNNSPNIHRLQRVWRVDESGPNMGAIRLTVHTADLPPAPTGTSKLVLLVDETSTNFPNFSPPGTLVLEIPFVAAANEYRIDYDFKDNTFFTIGWLRPTANFRLNEDFAVEGNPLPDSTLVEVDLELNFLPAITTGAHVMDYHFIAQSAQPVQDFNFNPVLQQAGVTFPAGQRSAKIPLWIKNDLLPENPSLETFLIVLAPGPNSTPGLFAGVRDTLIFSIFDNDPPPVASFSVASSGVDEGAGTHSLTVVRTGDISGSSSLRIARGPISNQGTATINADYALNSADGWLGTVASRYVTITFAPGESVKTAQFTILEDEIDEWDETIVFRLTNLAGIGVDATSILLHTVTIVDNDPEPTARFLSPFQSGFESIGEPKIYVQLDRRSVKDIDVHYEILTSGTASPVTDYTAASPGVIHFAPMDTLGSPLIFINNTDETPEPDETVVFKLTSAVNATIGSVDVHEYTIIDYAPFEWRGAAGVGRQPDNILWIDMDRVSGAHNTAVQNLTNFSPRNINILQNIPAQQAQLQTTSNLINNRRTLSFNGNNAYTIDDSPFINLAGFTGKKSFFFVIRTGPNVNTSTPQVIYEQGAGARGLSIYILSGRIYLNAWNLTNNGPESPWGGTLNNYTNSALRRFAHSHPILPNTNYIVSCHFDKDAAEKMVVYVNGRKGDRVETSTDVGRIYASSGGNGLGAIVSGTRFHNTNGAVAGGHYFTGLIAEFIKFHEPQMNEARRIIIENYLSAKYNIALHNSQTPQVFSLSNSDAANPTTYFGHQAAGLGSGITIHPEDVHLDAQGISQLRIRQPLSLSPNSCMVWGHNNIPLNVAYPFSFSNLPATIFTRSGRVWRSFTHGTVNNVQVLVNFAEIQDAFDFQTNDLKLLVHTDVNPHNFSNAVIYHAAQINSGPVVQFNNVQLPHGAYFTIGSASGMMPLPIELLHFTARLVGPHVDLLWATASEINNDYFAVERAGPDLNWHTLIEVPGAGHSSSVLNYYEKDRNPLAGISYYRLKQVDYDGVFTYSEPVAILNLSSDESEDIFLYPNPSRAGSVVVRIPLFLSGNGKLTLYDLGGKAAYQQRLDNEKTEHEIRYGALSKGMYILHVETDHLNHASKLVVE